MSVEVFAISCDKWDVILHLHDKLTQFVRHAFSPPHIDQMAEGSTLLLEAELRSRRVSVAKGEPLRGSRVDRRVATRRHLIVTALLTIGEAEMFTVGTVSLHSRRG